MTRGSRVVRTRVVLAGVAFCVFAGAGLLGRTGADRPVAVPVPAPGVTSSPAAPVPRAAPAPRGLPVIDYWTRPAGFPADPAARSAEALDQGLHPGRSLPVYDQPGGRARARVTPEISGMPLILPIAARRPGWVAVLLPTVNRRIGWLPAGGWTVRPLRDHLLVQRRAHRLTWLRDGVARQSWSVTTGTAATPTPLGRTFVLGRTPTSGAAFAGLDALALASVPDDRRALPAALRRAHTGIHGWYDENAFGRSASNGCVRLPRTAQRTLLDHIGHGTVVSVVD